MEYKNQSALDSSRVRAGLPHPGTAPGSELGPLPTQGLLQGQSWGPNQGTMPGPELGPQPRSSARVRAGPLGSECHFIPLALVEQQHLAAGISANLYIDPRRWALFFSRFVDKGTEHRKPAQLAKITQLRSDQLKLRPNGSLYHFGVPPGHSDKGQESWTASELQGRALTQGHQAPEVSSIKLLRSGLWGLFTCTYPGDGGRPRKVTKA